MAKIKPHKEPRFIQEQHDMLMRCSSAKDMSEWNDWRKMNRSQKVLLEGAQFKNAYLKDANFRNVQMKKASFSNSNLENARFLLAKLEFAEFNDNTRLDNAGFFRANLNFAEFKKTSMQNTELRRSDLEEADFDKTRLEGAIFSEAVLEGCRIYNSHLESTSFRNATVDHKTRIFDCSIDRYTDFTGVGIDATQIEPGLKAALKDNIRRIHWQRWLDKERKKSKWIAPWLWPWPVKLFWWVTDYGSSTKRIIGTFFALASAFCLIYWLFAMIPGSQSVIDELRQVPGPDRSTAPITFGCMHTLARAFYFSVVTMTTLGFGDMHAAKTGGWPSYAGYFFLSIQVIIGYVLLGALITRLGILFTGEAPAVELSPEKAKGNKDD